MKDMAGPEVALPASGGEARFRRLYVKTRIILLAAVGIAAQIAWVGIIAWGLCLAVGLSFESEKDATEVSPRSAPPQVLVPT
ncbi:hypothetical protein BOSEA31B_11493 [Hyphomicrobiales bacterium]|nr:hypothetical protein BOSEA31B_11493 [Hyphomicrobiales bacterium]CAH1697289.1 hypothetical protein BOSEA1005_10326 [Hyphomicrobiales bacterium]